MDAFSLPSLEGFWRPFRGPVSSLRSHLIHWPACTARLITATRFLRQSNLALYLLTGLVGALIGLDLWPLLARWLANLGLALPTWSQEYFGYRIALLAAITGGAAHSFRLPRKPFGRTPGRRFSFGPCLHRRHSHQRAARCCRSGLHRYARRMPGSLYLQSGAVSLTPHSRDSTAPLLGSPQWRRGAHPHGRIAGWRSGSRQAGW